jgi:hypothetical protein
MNPSANLFRTTPRLLFAGLVALVTACGSEDESMQGMEGMPGMSSSADSAQGAGDASAAMRAHMEQMGSMMPESMHAAMPEHRQMVANMLAQMNREMSSMNMGADAAWTATVDSIRSDLTSMPNMTADEMAAMMPAHHARVERLMSMHQAMMGRM